MVFEQGDIIEVDFDPTRGHEPQKKRPALVVSAYGLQHLELYDHRMPHFLA